MTIYKFQDTETREEVFHEFTTPSYIGVGSTFTHQNGQNYRISSIVMSIVTNNCTIYFGITEIN